MASLSDERRQYDGVATPAEYHRFALHPSASDGMER